MKRREAQGRLEARHRGPVSPAVVKSEREDVLAAAGLVAGTTMGVIGRRLEIGQIRTLPLGAFGVNPIGRYWITSSARSNSSFGIVSPSAFAVLRLMTSSNLVGCSIARSLGLALLRLSV